MILIGSSIEFGSRERLSGFFSSVAVAPASFFVAFFAFGALASAAGVSIAAGAAGVSTGAATAGASAEAPTGPVLATGVTSGAGAGVSADSVFAAAAVFVFFVSAILINTFTYRPLHPYSVEHRPSYVGLCASGHLSACAGHGLVGRGGGVF